MISEPHPDRDGLQATRLARRLRVVSTANNRYFPGVVVTFYSLLKHLASPWSVDFTLLTDGLEKQSGPLLERVIQSTARDCTLEIVPVDLRRYERLPADYGGGRLAYARLLMSELIDADEALYVDSDIVIQRDVGELTKLAWPEGCLLYAVPDPKGPTFATDGMRCDRVGVPPSTPYFNSGFLWANLGRWRRDAIAESCREFMLSFPEDIKWWDQSVLNAVLWKNWQQLDSQWNLLVDYNLGRFSLLPIDFSKRVNVHYLGPDKPWLRFNPYQQYYTMHFSQIAHMIPEGFAPYHSRSSDVFKRLVFFSHRAFRNYGSFCKQSLKTLWK